MSVMEEKQSLLTLEAKIEKVKSILPALERRGQFFIPDDVLYMPPLDDLGLQSMAKQIAAWIGFKPRALRIVFAQLKQADYLLMAEEGSFSLLINSRFKHDPFTCAGLLAEGLVQHFVEHRKRLLLQDTSEQGELIQACVIYAGLGLLIMNAAPSLWQQHYPRLYFYLHKSRPENQKRSLQTTFLLRFIDEYSLDTETIKRCLAPWALFYLPYGRSDYAPALNKIREARIKSRRSYAALFGSFLVIVCGLALSSFVLHQQPQYLSPAMASQKEEIDILRSSYQECTNEAATQQQFYGKQNDFYLDSSIDAVRERCQSLRNNYNFRVDQYNMQLQNK